MKQLYLIAFVIMALTSYSQNSCSFTENATSGNISSDGEATYGARSGDLNNDTMVR